MISFATGGVSQRWLAECSRLISWSYCGVPPPQAHAPGRELCHLEGWGIQGDSFGRSVCADYIDYVALR
jgi:hypothetical protein